MTAAEDEEDLSLLFQKIENVIQENDVPLLSDVSTSLKQLEEAGELLKNSAEAKCGISSQNNETNNGIRKSTVLSASFMTKTTSLLLASANENASEQQLNSTALLNRIKYLYLNARLLFLISLLKSKDLFLHLKLHFYDLVLSSTTTSSSSSPTTNLPAKSSSQALYEDTLRTIKHLQYQSEYKLREALKHFEMLEHDDQDESLILLRVDLSILLSRLLFERLFVPFDAQQQALSEKIFQEIFKETEDVMKRMKLITTQTRASNDRHMHLFYYFGCYLKRWSITNSNRFEPLCEQSIDKFKKCIDTCKSQGETMTAIQRSYYMSSLLKIGYIQNYWARRCREHLFMYFSPSQMMNQTSSSSPSSSSSSSSSPSPTATSSSFNSKTMSARERMCFQSMESWTNLISEQHKAFFFQQEVTCYVDVILQYCYSLLENAYLLIPSVSLFHPFLQIFHSSSAAAAASSSPSLPSPSLQPQLPPTTTNFVMSNIQNMAWNEMETMHADTDIIYRNRALNLEASSKKVNTNLIFYDLNGPATLNPIMDKKMEVYHEQVLQRRLELLQKGIQTLESTIEQVKSMKADGDSALLVLATQFKLYNMLSVFQWELAAMKSALHFKQQSKQSSSATSPVTSPREPAALDLKSFQACLATIDKLFEMSNEYVTKLHDMASKGTLQSHLKPLYQMIHMEEGLRITILHLRRAEIHLIIAKHHMILSTTGDVCGGTTADEYLGNTLESLNALQALRPPASQQSASASAFTTEITTLQNYVADLKRKNVIKEDFMLKLGEIRKNWKERWFVLTTEQLNYYDNNKKTKKLKKSVPIQFIKSISETKDSKQLPSKRAKEYPYGIQVEIPRRTFVICFKTETAVKEWMQALSYVMQLLTRKRSRTTLGPSPNFRKYSIRPSPTSPLAEQHNNSTSSSTTTMSSPSSSSSSSQGTVTTPRSVKPSWIRSVSQFEEEEMEPIE